MASKTKAEEDFVPQCEEHPRKKRKIDSLLPDAENENDGNLNYLVDKGGATLFTYENSSLSEQKAFDTQQKIEQLELDGVVHVYRGDPNFRRQAWNCWKQATILRERNAILKNNFPQSELEKLSFDNTREFQSSVELFHLFPKEPSQWNAQAFFVFQRISRKYHCFPDTLAVYHLFQFALRDWKTRELTRPQAFVTALYLFELFGTTGFLQELVRHPTESHDVVHSTFTEFARIFTNSQLIQLDISDPKTVLTFDHLMTSLNFSFSYQVIVRDHARKEQIRDIYSGLKIKSKALKLKEISKLILVILQLLVSIPKTENQSSNLKYQLETYIMKYENAWINQRPNLLLKACEAYKGNINDFKLIKLLLEAGGNPNVVDQYRRSPLHLLANHEFAFFANNGGPALYSTRAACFTYIVRAILIGRFHDDQVNLRGQTALECLKPFLQHDPTIELCQLLGNFLKGVRPLSCLAAKAVRKHKLPCECLPRALQFIVLQH